ncbi:hypothetical protein GCM10023116_21230 [Kistimonas scapharcae]|uniref:Uncharacterized protein n=1 Tax=Kistimonas scapharcae TaxID=1036133 RepID=A0ABP8V1T8_9GAMM
MMPIDDVDMGLDKAFDVLDVVRRLLSCPYIIPLVSGDIGLYEHITNLHFEAKTFPGDKKSSLQSKGVVLAERLTDSYLTKILPAHLRLPLKPVDELLPNIKIDECSGGELCSFFDYQKLIETQFSAWGNGQEKSTHWPKPDNSRELVQLVSSLPPSMLKVTDVGNTFKKQELWRIYQRWAEQQHDGVAYSNAYTVLQLARLNGTGKELDFSKLLAFSPVLQSEHSFDKKSKDFLQEQISLLAVFPNKSSGKPRSDIEANKSFLRGCFGENARVMRSMPPLEFYTSSMSVQSKHKDVDPLFRSLYTHKDYYGIQDNQIAKVFFSRAFEILATSLLVLSNEIELTTEDEWRSYLSALEKRTPFYSIHAINPSKAMENELDEDAMYGTKHPAVPRNQFDHSLSMCFLKLAATSPTPVGKDFLLACRVY